MSDLVTELLSESVGQPYLYPDDLVRSDLYTVTVNGYPVEVFHTAVADFAAFECAGKTRIQIDVSTPVTEVEVKPRHRGIHARMQAGKVDFIMDGPQNLCVDIPGQRVLFLYANAPERDKPAQDDPRVKYFRAGRTYRVGQLELHSGETLYIEAGAVVEGNILCRNAENVCIRGRGILSGRCYDVAREERVRSIVFEHCRQVDVRDIIMIEPTSWMLVLGRCNEVHVRNIRQIGIVMSSDGIDICGSSDVLIEDCCLRNDDDNIAVKALTLPGHLSWEADVRNVCVRHCVFLNGEPGNVMEIGFELRTGKVCDVVFEDIDVLYAHGGGAVFSIHVGDRADVERIRWENIRVEHYWDKLVDFRVVDSRYSKDAARGQMRDIVLKSIQVTQSRANMGYSISLMSGQEASRPVSGVVFEDVYLGDKKVLASDPLDLFTRHVEGLEFR